MVETTPVTKGEKIKEEWGDAVHEDLKNISKETADYVVFKEDGTIKARNGETGEIDYSGTDAATVIQNAIDDLDSAGGGHIYIKNGNYGGASVTLKGNVSFTIAPNVVNLSYTKGTNFNANIIEQGGGTDTVNAKEVFIEDDSGNVLAKIEDTATGGKITLYDETGTKRGDLHLDAGRNLVISGTGTESVKLFGQGTEYIRLTSEIIFRDDINMYIHKLRNAKEGTATSDPTTDAPDGWMVYETQAGNNRYIPYYT